MNDIGMEGEDRVDTLLVDAWNAFVGLERQHPDEASEFRSHIHALQGIVALRRCRGMLPDRYPTYAEDRP